MKHFKKLRYILAYSIILTSSAFSAIYWCPDLAGDDDNVNFADLAAFAENWRHTGSGLTGDFNKDNKVDLKDLAHFADYWLEETECWQYEGLTITQTLNSYPLAWSTYIGSNSAGSTYSWIMGPAGYLKANLVRNANNDGVAKIWIPIGNIYPAGTTAGHMQESWMQFDVKCIGGNQNSVAVWFGIFNSTGDTDNNPALYNAGVAMCGDGNTVAGDVNTIKIYSQGSSSASYGSPSSALRVKMHLYNSSSTYTSIVTEIYTIDSAGNVSSSPVWSSPERTVLHDASWPTAMDCFGIRNLNSSSSTSSTFLLDNMYFSTEGAFTGTMPKPSWVYGVSNTQTFNGTLPPSDWNAYMGAGSNDSTYFWQFGYNGGYLQTDLKLSQNNNGIAKIWKSIDIYPVGTIAGNVQESWMQFDVTSLSGSTTRQTAFVGVFNSAGDTDDSPEALFNLGSVGLLGTGTVTEVHPRGSSTGYSSGPSCRVKMHIYNSGPTYSTIAFEAYAIDSAGNVSSTAFYSGTNTFLSTGQELSVLLDNFGIRNSRSTNSTTSSVFLFDNMYFSTEGAFTGTMPVPSWVSADYPSATIYQKWDDNTWITSIGSGSNPATAITPLKNGKHYLYTDLYRNNVNSGRACIYAYLGSAAIPAGITGGNVQPFWLELDFRHISGGSFNTFFGLFNSSGDNDNNPVLNMLGAQLSGSDVQGVSRSSAGSETSTAIAYGGTNVLHRLKANVYNSGGKTLMNIDLYTINEETFEITKIGSVSGFVILDAGQSLPQGLNVFGIRNTPYSAGDPVVHSQFDLDNMYFSTESANNYHPVPSYADLCVSAVIQAGSSYFDPWNSTRWANWYSSGKLVKSFAIDCNVTLADRGGSSSPWSPDASGLSAGQLFLLGSCARGITFNGDGQFIDLRPDTYSLDYLYDPPFYAGFPSDSSLYGLDRCFYVVHGYKSDSIPETVIRNLWMKGFVQAIRSSSGQAHPLVIEDCSFRFNQWGLYLMGKNITAADNSILHSIKGGIYADKCSNVDIVGNTFQDNDIEQTALYGDIAMDAAHHNFIEDNEHLTPQGGDYHCGIKFYRNKGEADSLRENGANSNIISGNTLNGYSVAYEVGSRMGRDESYDLSDEGRDYASYNLFQNNSISNSTFGIKINTSGNEVNSNTFSSVTYPILLHNVFYSLTETNINNQNGTKVSYWFKNSDYTGNDDYADWFEYQNDQNGGIDVSDRYTHVSYTGTPSFDSYSGSATLLKRTGSNPSQIISTSTMIDVYKSGGVPIDIAVGDFWVDSPGDEVAVIWSTPVSNVDSTDYYTIIIYDSNGMEVNHCGRSTVKWEAIAAGDFLSNKGDEIAAVHSSAVDGYYPIYIFARGRKDPLVTLYTTNTTKIAELAGGNFKTDGDSYDEIAAIYTGGSPSIIYRKPTDTGWSASTTSVWSLIDIAAGNFDNTLDGDEVAGINATSSLIYFHRPGGISSYQYAGVEGGSAWRAIAASNFIYGSTAEVAVASSVASSGVYKIYCYGQGGTTPLKEINQNVLGVPANAISAGVSPAGATLGIYERAQGFTSSDYAATMVDWRNCVVVAPSSPQTTAIPLFWLNANPSDSSQKYLKVTPIVR